MRTARGAVLLGAVAIFGCGEPAQVDPCHGGICVAIDASRPAPGTDASRAVVTADASTRPDTGGGPCVESWTCSAWTSTGDSATRECVDSNACGTTATRPITSTTFPTLDREYYECNVEPIFDRGCAQLACHGTETGRALRIYARGRHRNAEPYVEPGCGSAGTTHALDVKCEGAIECGCWTLPHTATEWMRNYDSARAFAVDPATSLPFTDMRASELLRQPEIGGGLAHAGIHFWRADDPDYTTILRWLEGATLGRACNSGN